jgi:phage terminase large subunit GpA-like protein
LDSGRWTRYAITGPGQNGKSLLGFVIPTLYSLFELRETVFVGIPDMRLAQFKWESDFLPVIQSSFPGELRSSGAGSKGGTIKDSVRFTCGSSLKFMSAGQGDAGLAGPTTRTLVMTEVDKYDTAGEASREADPIRQMEARTNAFRDFGRRIIMECTVSIPSGRIWQEITGGTDSRLYHACPHCGVWSAWDRDCLVGWQDATDEFGARDGAGWKCSACAAMVDEQERRAMLPASRLVHRGQEITRDGDVTGPEPRTETFGLRWSAFDNPFVSTGRLGQDEWTAARSVNQDSAERAARQFVWAIPYEPPDIDLTHLEAAVVAERQQATKKGETPADCLGVTVGIDTGKRRLHWSAHALLADGSDVVIDYGIQSTQWETLGVTASLIQALQALRDYFTAGWRDATGKVWTPAQVWIDSGYSEHQAAVYAVCKIAGAKVWRPTKGNGEGVYGGGGRYTSPRLKSDVVRFIGRGMHMNWQRSHAVYLMHVDADFWKAEFHSRLKIGSGEPGSIRLYSVADPVEHADWSQHVTAERQIDVFEGGRRASIKWEQLRRENHWLDAGYLGTAAGWFVRDQMPGGESRKGRLSFKPLAEMGAR